LVSQTFLLRSDKLHGLIPAATTDNVPTAAPAAPRPRVLIVSSLISLPYRVMRVAHDAGAEVCVLGNDMSRGLKYSRFCAYFAATRLSITGEADAALAGEINRWVRALGIDMVLPGDAQATRSLIAMRDTIKAPCFPMPNLEQFDTLNNKWLFTKLCRELGILTPQSWVVEDAARLRAEIAAGRIPLPAIAKPINHDGSLGVIKLEASNALDAIGKIDYAPIIVQEFIDGRDIGASIYCTGGKIEAFIAHELKRATYSALGGEGILTCLARIATRTGIDGCYNFDMRLAPDGKIYYLECNPRFFFKIALSMLAGVNFVRPGLNTLTASPARPARGASVRLPKALLATLITPWKITKRDLKTLGYYVRDPISNLREMAGIDWEYPDDARERHFVPASIDSGDSNDDSAIAA
jgi:hypothetical protein